MVQSLSEAALLSRRATIMALSMQRFMPYANSGLIQLKGATLSYYVLQSEDSEILSLVKHAIST